MALPTKPQCVMSPLGHIVERCEGPYTQPELHRGIRGKYQLPETSCFYRPQLIYSWSEDASPETLPAMVQTAGLEPAHTSWCGALPTELRLHIPGIRRGQEERKDGWNEDTDITPHPHSDTYFYSLAPNLGQRLFFCDTIKVYSRSPSSHASSSKLTW